MQCYTHHNEKIHRTISKRNVANYIPFLIKYILVSKTMKKHIPNIITICNLLCGVLSTIAALQGKTDIAALYILAGIFFDFFDGMAARILNVASNLGKELDSLADVVTSGVAPGVILYTILNESGLEIWKYISLIIPALAAYRLAKFNIDTRQTHSFLGLPAPANATIWVGIGALYGSESFNNIGIIMTEVVRDRLFEPCNLWITIVIAIVGSLLMITEIPLFALKVKSLKWSDNKIRYIFILTDILLLILFGVMALPIIIIWYMLLSAIASRKATKKM